jgi:hypothetical protein
MARGGQHPRPQAHRRCPATSEAFQRSLMLPAVRSATPRAGSCGGRRERDEHVQFAGLLAGCCPPVSSRKASSKRRDASGAPRANRHVMVAQEFWTTTPSRCPKPAGICGYPPGISAVTSTTAGGTGSARSLQIGWLWGLMRSPLSRSGARLKIVVPSRGVPSSILDIPR